MIITTAATITFGSWLLDKIKDKGFDELYAKLTDSDEINKSFIKAVDIVSNKLQKKYPEILGGRIEYFFKNETVFKELIKLIFINSNVNIDIVSSNFDIETLPPNFILEFITELRIELLKDRELEKIISDKELFILINGISNDIELIAENSTLTLNELSEIKKILNDRISEKFSFDKFYGLYSKNVITNLSIVNFLGLGVDVTVKRNTKKLNDVYVKPNFKIIDTTYLKCNNIDINPFSEEHDINYLNIFDYASRIVVLGDPGSGKSILIKSIICNILYKDKDEFNNAEIINYLPFRIELRKYLAYKKQFRGNLLKYLNALLEEEYNISNITEKVLDDILNNKNSILFFDGLDEIFKVEDKVEIKNDIENFHNTYPKIKSITTSRIIGYEEAKLDNEKFCELIIQDFDDSQIEEYVEKWYLKEEKDEEIRQKEVAGFINKMNEIDNELISNPLLLSLIVIIYRNTLKLPESKLEIYHSCTKTLVDKWDASKDLVINIDPIIYRNKEKILADLAFWQYKELSSEEIKITYDKALKTVKKTIEDKLEISDIEQSSNFAEKFMEYAQKRSIYFDNNFTHKTFLEYYSAYWIYSNIEKKNKTAERNNLISQYIQNPFWHIVIELLLNMIDNDQADCEIMDQLLQSQLNDINSLPFILSTLNSFKNISTNFIETTVHFSIDYLINNFNEENQLEHGSSENLQNKIYDSLKNLYTTSPNIKKIAIKKLIEVEKTNSYNKLCYILYCEIDLMSRITDEDYIFELCDFQKFKDEVRKDRYLYIINCYTFESKSEEKNYFDVTNEFVKIFGADELFYSQHSYFDRYFLDGFILYYLSNQIKKNNVRETSTNLSTLVTLGIDFENFLTTIDNSHYFYYYNVDLEEMIKVYDIEKDKKACVFLLLLIFKIMDYNRNFEKNNIKSIIANAKKHVTLNKILKANINERGSTIIKMYKENYKNL